MIPVILYLLMGAYLILIIGVIFKINIMKMLAGFFMLLLAVDIIPNGIGALGNTTTIGVGIITIGLGAWHLIENLGDIEHLIKPKKEED